MVAMFFHDLKLWVWDMQVAAFWTLLLGIGISTASLFCNDVVDVFWFCFRSNAHS
jgi:hypothetical protein